ncbi:hypothetical protein EES37_36780 [Streptomyces sp. ADI91-18]|uniref:hypothetical protein n=1 Tax=Streptomyces sp. ADI91-18 TaxID=1522755 RepID=UPI000F554D0D|nr:hypothetical protein [Streptomyces sp. ADI91-18]RPK27476.1 hypothetical protein EES37_36780 [Streptomyces sp. ADI91-18]
MEAPRPSWGPVACVAVADQGDRPARLKGESDAKVNPQIANEYLSVNTQASILIREWATARADTSESDIQDYTRDVLEGRVRGTETAHKYLTDTTN